MLWYTGILHLKETIFGQGINPKQHASTPLTRPAAHTGERAVRAGLHLDRRATFHQHSMV